MDAHLKYRLTGAVILVLLAVLFVPELLTGPKPSQPGSGPQPAPTTADGAPLRSYDIDLSDPGTAAPPDGEPEPGPQPATSAAAANRPTSAREAPREAAPPATTGGAPVPRPAAPRAGASAPGSAAPPPGTGSSPRAQPLRGFAVQVGSFASRESAERLAGQLRGRRYEAFVSPVRSAGRQMFRVRVGPVDDRAAAQSLAARLAAAGQPGKVVPLP